MGQEGLTGSAFRSYGNRPLEDYERTIELQEVASEHLPDGTSTNARGRSPYEPHPMIVLERGDGAIVTDVDGNDYVDYNCGFSSIILGHAVPEQVDAVKAQVDDGVLFGTAHELEYETAKLINDLVPGSERVKFACSGTEANMAAMRLARAYTGKEKILKFEGMYHGHNDYVMVSHHAGEAELGSRKNPTKIPMGPGVTRSSMDAVEVLPWNDAALLEEVLERRGHEIAAVITEAVMSNGGLVRPRDGYLEAVRRLTEEHDVLLILDEVVTGFRMGLHGAQGHFGIEPDLATFGKALANGHPTAALTGKAEVMELLREKPGSAPFYGTYTGNPLALAGARANLEALAELGTSGYATFQERGQRLVEGVREIVTDAGHDVFVPDFAGFFFLHFPDGEVDPTTWTDWRDVASHSQAEKTKAFARAMIGEEIFTVPKLDRIAMTHAHTDEHVDRTLDAAKSAIEAVE